MYLHDDESATTEQLQCFIRRELALRQRRSLTYSVEMPGHTQNGKPWAVDTMVTVDDDYNRIHEDLYVLSRTFSKSRQGGTKTHLELIRPGTLEFADQEDAAPAAASGQPAVKRDDKGNIIIEGSSALQRAAARAAGRGAFRS